MRSWCKVFIDKNNIMSCNLGNINRCDIYILLWVLYSFQGILYSQGMINQLLQLLMLVWCLIVSSKYLTNWSYIPRLLKVTSLLVYMYLIYGLIYMLYSQPVTFEEGGSPASYYYLQQSLNSLLPIFLFYSYTKKGYITEKRLRAYFFIFTIVAVYTFQHTHQEQVFADIYGRTEFTNNVGYTFLALMPMLYMFNKKPIVQYVLASILLLFIVMSMKRGAIVIGTLCFSQFLYQNWKSSSRAKDRLLIVLLTLSILGVAYYFVSNMLEHSDLFLRRLEATKEMDSSGRYDLVSIIWKKYWASISVISLLLGNGANSTISFAGNYAHQDWLETLCNNGVVGVGILLSFYITFLKTILSRRLLNCQKYLKAAFLMLFLICIMKTIFSMSIQGMEISITMMIGFLNYNEFKNDENTSSY